MLAGVATQQAQQLPLLFTDEKVLPVEQVEGEVAPGLMQPAEQLGAAQAVLASAEQVQRRFQRPMRLVAVAAGDEKVRSHHWQQHLHQRRIVEDGLRSTPVVAQRGDQFGVGLGAPVAADIVFGGRGYTGEE